MTRREALALGGSATFLTGFGLGAGVAQDRDAALLTLLARFDALEQQRRRMLLAIGDDRAAEEHAEAVLDALEAEQAQLHPLICASRAGTLAGLHARGLSLTQWAPQLLAPAEPAWDQQAVAAVLRDLVALPGNMNAVSFSA
ncbi:hypothetical protein ACVFYP_07480 [Roseomonas sp. F4]